jgi:hypothetical protein
MHIAQQTSWGKGDSFGTFKSFLIWSFTLGVCFLVVGFPIVVIMTTIGCLSALVLQSVLSISSVLIVAGMLIGGSVLSIFIGAGILTLKGINPQDVSWLRWLNGEASPLCSSVYAACPLTCEIPQ